MEATLHTGDVLDTVDSISVIECTSCGFKHIDPLPTDAELEQLYEEEFYATERPRYFSDAEEDLAWWMATYRNYFSLLESNTEGRRILDIGSGPGYFLRAGMERGWDVLGIEPSSDACAYAREKGVPVVQDFFSYERAKEHGLFDVVHASMVLEHVPNPIQMIEDMKKMLRPGGIIAIFSPNDYTPFQKVLREGKQFPPWWVVPTHHLNYFNVASLQALLTRMGTQVVDTISTFPMEFFLLAGRNYIEDGSLGRGAHHMRTSFEESLYEGDPALLNSIYRHLATIGVGREVMIIAKIP